MDKYINRLLDEWIRHKKIVISVDFDDTLFPYKLGNTKEQERVLHLLKISRELGCYIVIFTARNIDGYKEVQDYCNEIKLPIDAINKNPIDLPYGRDGKIFYNINLCDRSGLVESLDILESTIDLYIKHLNNQPYTT